MLEHPDHRPNLLYRKTGSAMSDGTQCALETRYGGCRFRSRIEARWAVFFTHMSIQWEYEPQGFHLPTGNYLPDFRLRFGDHYVWWEVKGQKPNRDEMELAWELYEETGSYVYIAHGDIPRDHREQSRVAAFGAVRARWFVTAGSGRDWAKSTIGLTPVDLPQEGVDHPLLLAAYTAARSARFEHGERG